MGATGRVFQIGENGGILKAKLFKAGRSVNVIPPTAIKKFATGYGNAIKELMESSFAKISDINFRELTNQAPRSDNPSSDLIDAYFIATYPL